MIDLAERVGAERLLTGHYARIVEDADGPLLAAAADRPRTRATCSPPCRRSCSSRLGFPLTELTKPEVREIAARHGLAVARKAESQDLCFLAGQGKRGFLRRHGGLREREGAIVDSAGRTLGRHRGHHDFTVGQRRGIGVSAPEAALRPRHRRRRQHGHGRHPRRAGEAQRPRPRRRPPPRRRPRSTRSSCATAPAPSPPRSRRRGRGGIRPWRWSWARPSPASPRARRRCSWPAIGSSATAPSPPKRSARTSSGDRAGRHRRGSFLPHLRDAFDAAAEGRALLAFDVLLAQRLARFLRRSGLSFLSACAIAFTHG